MRPIKLNMLADPHSMIRRTASFTLSLPLALCVNFIWSIKQTHSKKSSLASWIQSTRKPHSCFDWIAAAAGKKSVHLHPDEYRVLDRLPKGYIYIKRGSWHVMKLFLPPCRHIAPLYQRAGLYPLMQQLSPLIHTSVWTLVLWGNTAVFWIVFISGHFFLEVPHENSAAGKRKVGGSTALSHHLLSPSVSGLVGLLGSPSANYHNFKKWDTSHPRHDVLIISIHLAQKQ